MGRWRAGLLEYGEDLADGCPCSENSCTKPFRGVMAAMVRSRRISDGAEVILEFSSGLSEAFNEDEDFRFSSRASVDSWRCLTEPTSTWNADCRQEREYLRSFLDRDIDPKGWSILQDGQWTPVRDQPFSEASNYDA